MANNTIDFWNLLGKREEDNTSLLSPLKKDTPISEDIDEGLNIENPQAGNSQLPVVGKIPAQKLGAYDTKTNEEAVRQKYWQGKDQVIPATLLEDDNINQNKTDINESIPQKSLNKPETEVSTADKYKQMLEELASIRNEPKKDLTLLRGGNQIAQALAAGYGGKIGDNNDVVNILEEGGRKQRYDELLNQLKVMKEIKDGKSSKNLVGFGQFVTKNGEPVMADPTTGQIINTVTGLPHNPQDGLVPRAVDRVIYGADGQPLIVSPGRTAQDELSAASKGVTVQEMNANVIPQNPYEATRKLDKRDRDVLDKDVDQFQQEVKDTLRMKSELSTIDPLIENAKENPAAAKAIGGLIAQVFQGGRLSDSDTQLYVGRVGLVNWLDDAYSKFIKGEANPEMLDQVKEYISLYQQALEKSLPDRALMKANNISARFNPNSNISPEVLSELYYSKKNTKAMPNSIVSLQLPDGRIVKVTQEKAEKYLKDSRYKIVK